MHQTLNQPQIYNKQSCLFTCPPQWRCSLCHMDFVLWLPVLVHGLKKTCWGSPHQQRTLLCSCKYLHEFLGVSDSLLAFPCLSTACNDTRAFDCAASTDMSAVRADFSCVAKTSVRSGWQPRCPQQTRGLKGTLLAQTLLTSCHCRISCCMSMPLVQQHCRLTVLSQTRCTSACDVETVCMLC